MDDLNKNKAVVDLPDVEASPTTRLLKKKTDGIQGETAGTAPLTHRLADISTIGEAEEKKKSGAKWLIIGIVAVVLIGAGVGGYFFLSSDESGIFSGGGSGIDGSGTDSMDANIVQGGGAAPSLPADRTAAAPGETRTAATAAPTAAPSAGPAQPAPAPEPSASTVEAARVDKPTSAISSGSDAAPSIGAPAAPAPATTTPAAPAAAAPAPSAPESGNSLESGFTLSEQAQVKEGDLVPLTADVIKPEIVSRSQPRMPPLAQQMRKSGQVIVRVLVDENGSVSDARLVSENPKGFGFGQAALDAAGKFKYKPARKGNVRVRVWDTIFFTFR